MAANDASADQAASSNSNTQYDGVDYVDEHGGIGTGDGGGGAHGGGGDDDKQQQESHEYHQDGLHSDDLDLQNAIGDVFGQFDFASLAGEAAEEPGHEGVDAGQEQHHQQDQSHHPEAVHHEHQEQHHIGHDDTHQQHEEPSEHPAVQDQQNYGQSVPPQDETHASLEHEFHVEPGHHDGAEGHEIAEGGDDGEDDDDFDLSAAIGDAFALVQGDVEQQQQQPQDQQVGQETAKAEQAAHAEPVEAQKDADQHADEQALTHLEDDHELDLEAAIGNAFESITGLVAPEEEKEHETTQETQAAPETQEPVEKAEPQVAQPEHTSHQATPVVSENLAEQAAPEAAPETAPIAEKSPESHIADDLDLESAIGNAFKEITDGISQPDAPAANAEASAQPAAENLHEQDEEDLDLESAIGNAFKALNEEQQSQSANEPQQASAPPPPATTLHAPRPQVAQQPIHEPELPALDHDDEDFAMENAISEAFKSAIKPFESAGGPSSSSAVSGPSSEVPGLADTAKGSQTTQKPTSELQAQPTLPTNSNEGLDLSSVVQNLVNQISIASSGDQAAQAIAGNNLISEDILQELALEITNQVQDQGSSQNKKNQQHQVADMPQIDDNVLAHFQNEAYKDDIAREDQSQSLESKFVDNNSLQAALATVVRNAIESNATTLSDNPRRKSIFAPTVAARASTSGASSIPSGLGSSDGKVAGGEGESADLDQLRMNEILQNAFNMAMENPQDLLNNIEMDEDVIGGQSSAPSAVSGTSAAVAAALSKLTQHPLPSSTASFLESLNRSQDIDLSGTGSNKRTSIGYPQSERIAAVAKNIMNAMNENASSATGGERKKSLSIAETLALHRSSMTGGPRRDYSSIESMDEILRSERSGGSASASGCQAFTSPYMSNGVVSTQLSNALSSLSSHINSGNTGGETNLLNVIRQMTNSLSSSKLQGYTFLGSSIGSSSSTNNVPTVEEIVSSYKNDENLGDMTQALKLARSFLERNQSIESDNQAIGVIDNVIGMFNNNSSTNQFEQQPGGTQQRTIDLSDVKPDAISTIRDSVISSVSNFTNSKHWRMSTLLGEKPKSDTPEYKERIRMENRERKKRWREENAERNKDNDLRSRVLKRANAMFGDSDSFEKKAWVDDEFNKRREKRIAKQKKEDQERSTKSDSSNYFGDSSLDSSSGNNATGSNSNKPFDVDNPLVHDQTLVKNITDTFNILSGSTTKVEPSAALAATSVATATIAALYAKTHGILDFQQVSSAVSSILSTLMDNAGQKDRLISLSRGLSSNFKGRTSGEITNNSTLEQDATKEPSNSTSSSGLLNRITSTIRGYTSGVGSDGTSSSVLGFENLNLAGEKRKPTEYLSSDAKRRSISPSGERKSLMEQASQLWNTNPLKIPQYKKPEPSNSSDSTSETPTSANVDKTVTNVSTATSTPGSVSLSAGATAVGNQSQPAKIEYGTSVEKSTPTLTAPSVSPFISNKVASSTTPSTTTTTPAAVGLRKPGTFQRPAFSKPDNKKGHSMGFPTLYSASFRK